MARRVEADDGTAAGGINVVKDGSAVGGINEADEGTVGGINEADEGTSAGGLATSDVGASGLTSSISSSVDSANVVIATRQD